MMSLFALTELWICACAGWVRGAQRGWSSTLYSRSCSWWHQSPLTSLAERNGRRLLSVENYYLRSVRDASGTLQCV